MKIGLLVAGYKGYKFLEKIYKDFDISFVSSYLSKGLQCDTFSLIQTICDETKITFLHKSELNINLFKSVDLVVVVGWQYILRNVSENVVVFHDSLLPKYRGFAPTVNTLINGENTLGVTAFKPINEVDAGAIYHQCKTLIAYPIKVCTAYDAVCNLYVTLLKNLIFLISKHGMLIGTSQDEAQATYSIWRDELDYQINWCWSANRIRRFVDTVGYPYLGAVTGNYLVDEVEIVKNLTFEGTRPIGKVWTIEEGNPVVVCGNGMLKILHMRSIMGKKEKVKITKLRTRL